MPDTVKDQRGAGEFSYAIKPINPSKRDSARPPSHASKRAERQRWGSEMPCYCGRTAARAVRFDHLGPLTV